MLDYLKARFHKSPIKEDIWLHRNRDEEECVRNPQFVSFLQQSGFRKRQLTRHDKTKRLKRVVAFAMAWVVLMGFAWIAFESAEALELF